MNELLVDRLAYKETPPPTEEQDLALEQQILIRQEEEKEQQANHEVVEKLWAKRNRIYSDGVKLGRKPYMSKMKHFKLDAVGIYDLVALVQTNHEISVKAEKEYYHYNTVTKKNDTKPVGGGGRKPQVSLEHMKSYETTYPTGRGRFLIEQVLGPIDAAINKGVKGKYKKSKVAKAEPATEPVLDATKKKEITETLLKAWSKESKADPEELIHFLLMGSLEIDPAFTKTLKDYAADLPMSMVHRAIEIGDIKFFKFGEELDGILPTI